VLVNGFGGGISVFGKGFGGWISPFGNVSVTGLSVC